jgi:dimethylargininase
MLHAIVREPSKSFGKCISSHPLVHTISVEKAREQHRHYCHVLDDLGVDLIRLDPDHQFPDSCFVEDTAVIHKKKALISRMGALSRRGEEQSILQVLNQYLSVKQALHPATLEGGDVIHTPDYLISGVTQRTNKDGIQAMREWLEVEVKTVSVPEIIHLKSFVTFLDHNTVIMQNQFDDHPVFLNFDKIIVKDNESYSVNTLTIDGTVLVPMNHPDTVRQLKNQGYEVVPMNISEFEKCEGALTCLSLFF